MFRFKIILIFLIWTFVTVSYANDQQGFDEICKIYTEAKNSNMKINTMSEYIFGNIKNRVSSKEVLRAHEAVMEAMADERYMLFKQSAEHVLKSKWSCTAMEKVMSMKVN